MTKRALFWCGFAKLPPGRFGEPGASEAAYTDATTIANDLDFAVQAARSLGVEDHHMQAFVCSPDLLPAGYAGELSVPTISAFERVVTRLAAATPTADDVMLFFATNHGMDEGLLTSAHVDELEPDAPSFLSPEALGAALDRLPGAQVLVIAVCFAGVFLAIAQADRRLVLAACGAVDTYFAGGSTAWAAFPAELFRAWCSVSPDGGDCPVRMDLDEAFDFAVQRVMSGEVGRTIPPLRAGSVRWPR
jgi:hypothetical protein